MDKQHSMLFVIDMDQIIILQQCNQTISNNSSTFTESDIIDKFTEIEHYIFCNTFICEDIFSSPPVQTNKFSMSYKEDPVVKLSLEDSTTTAGNTAGHPKYRRYFLATLTDNVHQHDIDKTFRSSVIIGNLSTYST